jgi:hypothetical protein
MLAVQRELPYGARLHLPLLEKVSDLSLMLDDDGIGSAYGWNSRNVNPSMMALLSTRPRGAPGPSASARMTHGATARA